MLLYDVPNLNRHTLITAVDGVSKIPALTIFTLALEYLKDHLIAAVAQQVVEPPSASQIKWVVTVPAIWGEKAKHFMREAALSAKLITEDNPHQLLLALEPECASLHCRNLNVSYFHDENEGETPAPSFPAGCRYVVVDAGGGTVDFTAHEVLVTGQVMEVNRATGGGWGGSKINDNIIQKLEQVFGREFMEFFKRTYPSQWLMFLLRLEFLKRLVKPDGQEPMKVPITYNFSDAYEKYFNNTDCLRAAIERSAHLGVRFSNGYLIFNNDVVLQFFIPIINSIVHHLEELLQKKSLESCQYILLVGGFGECKLLQRAVKQRFGASSIVLIPEEAQLAIIRGAIEYCHNPSIIQSRKAKKTYGLKVNETFDSSIHKRERKHETADGQTLCCNVFQPFVCQDDDIKVGEVFQKSYWPQKADDIHIVLEIFEADSKDIKYVTDDGCRRVKKMNVELGNIDKGLNREIKVQVLFGSTEMEIRAVDVESGAICKCIIGCQ